MPPIERKREKENGINEKIKTPDFASNEASSFQPKANDGRANPTANFSRSPAGRWRLYNVVSTSMQRHDVASTLTWRCINVMCPMQRHDVVSTLRRRCINVMCPLRVCTRLPPTYATCKAYRITLKNYNMTLNVEKGPLCHLQTARIQMSVRIRAV